MRIAILEDEPSQRALLHLTLEQMLTEGYAGLVCHLFSDGEELRRVMRRDSFDLLLLDWNVPGVDGLELVHWLRTWQKNPVAILMLSSRSSEHDVAQALMAGVDDYIAKPFRRLELKARVLKLLSRNADAGKPASQHQRFGRWSFDKLAETISLHESGEPDSKVLEKHTLSTRQFTLAFVLFSNLGRNISRKHLQELIGFQFGDLSNRALDSQIYRLRKELGLESHRGIALKTLYGQGYRLEEVNVGKSDAPEQPDEAIKEEDPAKATQCAR